MDSDEVSALFKKICDKHKCVYANLFRDDHENHLLSFPGKDCFSTNDKISEY